MSTTPAPNALLQLSPGQVNRAQPEQFRQLIRQALDDVRCSVPAFLTEDMDAGTQTVTVQIAIQERAKTNKGAVWMDLPPIILVPVVLPRGGGYSITLPLKKGDNGLLIFCDTCFDHWFQFGQSNSKTGTQPQNEIRRHDLHDCGFLPGMWSQVDLLSNYSSTSLQIRRDDESAFVDVAEGLITVNKNGGTAQFLLAAAFYTWYTTNVEPFLQGLGYSGPPPPTNSLTQVLKGA